MSQLTSGKEVLAKASLNDANGSVDRNLGGRARGSKTNPLCLEIAMTRKVLRELEAELEEEKRKKRTARELEKKEAKTLAAKAKRLKVEEAVARAKEDNIQTIDKNAILPPKKRKVGVENPVNASMGGPLSIVERPGTVHPTWEGNAVIVPVGWSKMIPVGDGTVVQTESEKSSSSKTPQKTSSVFVPPSTGFTSQPTSGASVVASGIVAESVGNRTNKKSSSGNK